MSGGFFSLPRSLTRNPLWMDLPPAYKEVFLVILDHAVYIPQKFDDHGHIIDLKPGQLCISERDLLKLCGKYISRNEIQRSIKKLILYDFVSQKVSHRKSILTITHKDTYDLFFKSSEPTSAPNLSQTRAKLEPESNKENKEKKEINKTYSSLATSLLTEFFDSLILNIPSFNPDKTKKTSVQLAAMERMLIVHGEEKIRRAFKYAHESDFWRAHVHTALYLEKKFETLLAQMQNKKDEQKKELIEEIIPKITPIQQLKKTKEKIAEDILFFYGEKSDRDIERQIENLPHYLSSDEVKYIKEYVRSARLKKIN